jgi:hypothetical protein
LTVSEGIFIEESVLPTVFVISESAPADLSSWDNAITPLVRFPTFITLSPESPVTPTSIDATVVLLESFRVAVPFVVVDVNRFAPSTNILKY